MNTHNIRAMRVLRERRAEQQRRACERMQHRQETGGKLLPRTVVIDEWHVDSDGNMCRSMGAEG